MNWPAITAISTAIIAIFVVVMIVALLVFVSRLMVLSRVVRSFVETLERDTRPALETAKSLIGESQRVAVQLTVSTVMSVIESQETLDQAISLVKNICGDLTQPSTGILFTLPIGRVEGLAPILESDPTTERSDDETV